jgi:hypothetical protein
MTEAAPSDPVSRPPIATGWLLWLTWFFVIVLSGGVIFSLLILLVGPGSLAASLGITVSMPVIGVWWAIQQLVSGFFGVACIGVLLRDRDLARIAVALAWIVVACQCIDAVLQLSDGKLVIPFGAVLYVAFALKLTAVLDGPGRTAREPPGARGAI